MVHTRVSHVRKERPGTDGSVELAFCVALEREQTNRSIVCAGREAQQGVLSLRRVASRIASVWRRDHGSRCGYKRKAPD